MVEYRTGKMRKEYMMPMMRSGRPIPTASIVPVKADRDIHPSAIPFSSKWDATFPGSRLWSPRASPTKINTHTTRMTADIVFILSENIRHSTPTNWRHGRKHSPLTADSPAAFRGLQQAPQSGKEGTKQKPRTRRPWIPWCTHESNSNQMPRANDHRGSSGSI